MKRRYAALTLNILLSFRTFAGAPPRLTQGASEGSDASGPAETQLPL